MTGRLTYPRERLLVERRREVQDGRAELGRLEHEARRSEGKLRSLSVELRARRGDGATAAKRQAEARFREALRERVERQRDLHRRATSAVDRAAASLTGAARRLEAVERDRRIWERQLLRGEASRDQRGTEDSLDATFRKRRS